MRAPFLRFCLLLVAFGAVVGCSTSSNLRGIAVQLEDLQARPTDQGGAQVTLQVRYHNENLVAIAVARTTHRVTINGLDLGEVSSERAVGLPQMGTELQELTLTVPPAIAAQLRGMAGAGRVGNYTLNSRIEVEAGNRDLRSRTSGSGSIDLSGVQL